MYQPTTRIHPSDQIHEATDFVDATHRYEVAIAHEVGIVGDDDGFWERERRNAEEARRIYGEAANDADAVRRLRAAGLDTFADALASDDWSILAF